MAQSYGYTGYYKPPKPPRVQSRSLASAAAGRPAAHDPFGLLTDTTDSARVARQNMTPRTAGTTVIRPRSDGGASGDGFGGTDVGIPPGYPGAAAAQPPVAPKAYDINTDPALQETVALTGMSDEQAHAEALKQKQNQALAYGDPELVRKLFGDESLAQAAAQNPTSTRAQLGTQRDRKLGQLTEDLNKQNLGYSGWRINQEQQAGSDFENALAQAAAGVNTNIDQINSSLAGALSQNEMARLQARAEARDRHALDFGAVDPLAGAGLDGVVIPPLDQAAAPGITAGADAKARARANYLALMARERSPGGF